MLCYRHTCSLMLLYSKIIYKILALKSLIWFLFLKILNVSIYIQYPAGHIITSSVLTSFCFSYFDEYLVINICICVMWAWSSSFTIIWRIESVWKQCDEKNTCIKEIQTNREWRDYTTTCFILGLRFSRQWLWKKLCSGM